MRLLPLLFIIGCSSSDLYLIMDIPPEVRTNYVEELVPVFIDVPVPREYTITNYIQIPEPEEPPTIPENTAETVGLVGVLLMILRLLPGKIGDKVFDLLFDWILWPFKWVWGRVKKN